MRGADEKEDKRERRGKDRQRKRIKGKKSETERREDKWR